MTHSGVHVRVKKAMRLYRKRWLRLSRFFKKKVLRHPMFDGKVRVYLTLRCNLKCDFCVNTYVDGGLHLSKYGLLPPGEWIRILNTLDRDIVLAGGEPLLYRGLGEIIQGINHDLEITVYSNLTVPIKGDTSWLCRKGLKFYGSYHPTTCRNDRVFIENVQLLKRHKVSFVLHSIKVIGREKLEKLCAERLGGAVPSIVFDEDQRNLFESSSKKFKKRVSCQRAIILIAPDGTRYQCVSRMVRRVEPFENLVNEPFSGGCRTVSCGDYGYCAPCDGLGETRQWPVTVGE